MDWVSKEDDDDGVSFDFLVPNSSTAFGLATFVDEEVIVVILFSISGLDSKSWLLHWTKEEEEEEEEWIDA